jgi:hypothetical protein
MPGNAECIPSYSDSNGGFIVGHGLGATTQGDDATDRVKKCTVSFSKNGYKDTSFTVYNEDLADTINIKSLKIFLHP